MAAQVNSGSVYISDLKNILDGLDTDANNSLIALGAATAKKQAHAKTAVISITITWASIMGIYEGLTGDKTLRRKYAISRWVDDKVTGLEGINEIFKTGIEIGETISDSIRDAADMANEVSGSDGVQILPKSLSSISSGFSRKKTSFGGGRCGMRGGAPGFAQHLMTIAIISCIGGGVVYSGAPSWAYITARDYLIQLAYANRVVTGGCRTASQIFWNNVAVNWISSGALESCLEQANRNAATLQSLRTTIVTGFTTLISTLSGLGLYIGSGQLGQAYNFIRSNLANPLCDLIASISSQSLAIAGDAAAASGRMCHQQSTAMIEGIHRLNNPIRQLQELLRREQPPEGMVAPQEQMDPLVQPLRVADDAPVGRLEPPAAQLPSPAGQSPSPAATMPGRRTPSTHAAEPSPRRTPLTADAEAQSDRALGKRERDTTSTNEDGETIPAIMEDDETIENDAKKFKENMENITAEIASSQSSAQGSSSAEDISEAAEEAAEQVGDILNERAQQMGNDQNAGRRRRRKYKRTRKNKSNNRKSKQRKPKHPKTKRRKTQHKKRKVSIKKHR